MAGVKLEINGKVATLRLNKPERRNAIGWDTAKAFHEALDVLEESRNVGCVVIASAVEGVFCAGADVEALRRMQATNAYHFVSYFTYALERLEEFRSPVVACVDGYALGGGCELVMACDLVYCSSRSSFGQPEVRLGLVPGFGGSQRLPRRIGLAASNDLLITGRTIQAEEALKLGLVSRVFQPDALGTETDATVSAITAQSAFALQELKRLLRRGAAMPLREALRLESEVFARCLQSPDAKEGIDAFLNKRKPNYTTLWRPDPKGSVVPAPPDEDAR